MITEELYTAISKMDESKVLPLISEIEASELKGNDVIEAIKAIQDGMSEVGRRFETGEYFLAELVFAAELCKQVMEVLRPRLKTSNVGKKGKMVLGTAKDDIHDIGKDLVRDLFESTGFEVFDLGVDVPYSKFVDKIEEVNPEVVAGVQGSRWL